MSGAFNYSGGSTGSTGNSGGNGNNIPPTGSNGTGNLVLGAPGVGLDYYIVQKTPFSHISEDERAAGDAPAARAAA